ncbi:hypothetical protein [Streptomyces sp. AcE210]|uniref:hypothetical protein n=1 Tax=Streptomyces sp. AcE210 TaxID=2292703 RepID=UPI00105911C7|nr:hypothetical protein [Streptomyces sp. AcE210]
MQNAAAARPEAAEATAVRAAQEAEKQRKHNRHTADLVVVFGVVAVAMLRADVYIAKVTWWLATLLSGTGLLTLAKISVLRHSDPADMKFASQAERSSTIADGQTQPSPVSARPPRGASRHCGSGRNVRRGGGQRLLSGLPYF